MDSDQRDTNGHGGAVKVHLRGHPRGRRPGSLRRKVLCGRPSVSDKNGLPVLVSVQAADNSVYGVFCGKTTDPIAIDPMAEVDFIVSLYKVPTFYLWLAEILGCPVEATSGRITATFWSRK